MDDYNFFEHLFDLDNVEEVEKRLYVLYKTNQDEYRRYLNVVKILGYRVFRNGNGNHKVVRGNA